MDKATVHTLFENQAQLNPDKPALLYGNHRLTYMQLNEQANQLAHYLVKLGVKQDSPIAFCLERSVNCLVTMMAILKAGAAYMPLDASFPEERLLSLLEDSNTAFLITHTRSKDKFKAFEGTVLVLDQLDKVLQDYPKSNLNLPIPPNYLAYVIYTSGSTGKPKGVLIEHASVVNFSMWFADFAQLQANDRIDFSSNHCFDMAVSVTISSLMLGLTTVLCEDEIKNNIRLYLRYLNRYKINLIKVTPSYFKLLLHEVRYQKIKLPHLKHIGLGGENLTTQDCKFWLSLYPKHRLVNEYGPTETTVAVSQFLVTQSNVNSLGINVPIGTPGPQMVCYILDANNEPVEQEVTGELHIGGLCLARGYLNQPELTQARFIEVPASKLGEPENTQKTIRLYKTGDLCRFRSDKVIEYFGRMDSQVKIRGYRVDLGEIEQCLTVYPSLSNVIVCAQKEMSGASKLVAYYILKADSIQPSFKNLRQHMQQSLPEFMIPSAFICVETFPLTGNGKIQTDLLPTTATLHSKFRAPGTAVQKKLVQFWSEELGLAKIGLDDDFFELGGHSLSAARIVSKIYHILGFDLSVKDFYESGTIDRLSFLLSTKIKQVTKKLEPIKATDTACLPLSDFQFVLWITHRFQFKVNTLNITVRKRLKGPIDEAALDFALNALIKKQSIFSYQIAAVRPLQFPIPLKPIRVAIQELQTMNAEESKKILEQSMNELTYYKKWKKSHPLLVARLFYLKNKEAELQISLSHLIGDEASAQILLKDLSGFYKAWQEGVTAIEINTQYETYILNEQDYVQDYLQRDIEFWNTYLKEASLFQFPLSCVEKKMHSKKVPYSTYKKISDKDLEAFKNFCKQNKINLYEGLSAAIALALTPYCENKGALCINRVKSTRTEAIYDDSLGCFLKIEPLKVNLEKKSTFDNLLHSIHQSMIDTSLYQQSPTFIKLSSIKNFNLKKKKWLEFILKPLVRLYGFIFSFPLTRTQILQKCLVPLASIRPPNDFLININIHKDFIEHVETKNSLFNLKEIHVPSLRVDLLSIDGVLEVCFKRDDSGDPFLILSGNLKPEVRMGLAKGIIRVLRNQSKKSPSPLAGGL